VIIFHQLPTIIYQLGLDENLGVPGGSTMGTPLLTLLAYSLKFNKFSYCGSYYYWPSVDGIYSDSTPFLSFPSHLGCTSSFGPAN
jgi:hypothetical protein